MTISIWIAIFGGLGMVSLISFMFFFIKDSRLRVEQQKNPLALLVDGGLLCVALLAVIAAVLLYLNWQEQLNQFIS
ncbi:hypothetical protein [Enterococcus alishanensis]|uniref:Uncharacterized protein n=1 Tax=Enterococcus alishanensis TaxID=1303817 RepID=A0ABS6THM0_9ENTE|nr:hypothetical protein [Enterococcus alishanensis]MBV7392274.1 hypothetical protein [Enterococcus alishanensis]